MALKQSLECDLEDFHAQLAGRTAGILTRADVAVMDAVTSYAEAAEALAELASTSGVTLGNSYSLFCLRNAIDDYERARATLRDALKPFIL